MVTFKNGGDVREVVAGVPLDRILLETDAPYMAPTPFRGQTCHPAWFGSLLAAIAAFGVPVSESSTRVAPTPVASTASSTSTSTRPRYLVDLYRFTVVSIVVDAILHRSASSGELASPVDVTSRRAPSFDATFARIAPTSSARASAPSVAMTTSSSSTTRERLVVTMNDPTSLHARRRLRTRRARAAVRFIVLVRNRLRDRPGETRDRRLRVAVGVRRPWRRRPGPTIYELALPTRRASLESFEIVYQLVFTTMGFLLVFRLRERRCGFGIVERRWEF